MSKVPLAEVMRDRSASVDTDSMFHACIVAARSAAERGQTSVKVELKSNRFVHHVMKRLCEESFIVDRQYSGTNHVLNIDWSLGVG
jgi:hypothetical protein